MMTNIGNEDLKTVNETQTQAVQPTSNFDPSPVNQ